MKSSQAIEQIRNSVFKPGWEMEASSFGGDLIILTFYIHTTDTSYPDFDGVCRKPITLVRDELVDVSPMDEVALCAAIICLADQIDIHEDREFLKVRQPDGSWKALLHPHTAAGERAWDKHVAGRVPA